MLPEIGYSVVKVEGSDFCPLLITASINGIFNGLRNNIFFGCGLTRNDRVLSWIEIKAEENNGK